MRWISAIWIVLFLSSTVPAKPIETQREHGLLVGFLVENGRQSDKLAIRYKSGPALVIPGGPLCDFHVQRATSRLYTVFGQDCGPVWLMLIKISDKGALRLVDVIKSKDYFDFNIEKTKSYPNEIQLVTKNEIGYLPSRLAVSADDDGFHFSKQPPPRTSANSNLSESVYKDLYRLDFSVQRIKVNGCSLYSEQTKKLQARWALKFCEFIPAFISAINYLKLPAADRIRGIGTATENGAKIGTNYVIE